MKAKSDGRQERQLTLPAGVKIPLLLTMSHDVGATITRIHTWFGDAILWLAEFHALTAIYHHFVLGNGMLVSMLPRWIPLRQSNLKNPANVVSLFCVSVENG